MKNYSTFNYDFLLGDHFAKISHEAFIYYVHLNFHANNGFVANPLRILDSLGFPKAVFDELVSNDEIIVQEDRNEIFITAYYVHNPGFKPSSWLNSPFAQYWKGKLSTKENRVAKFKPEGFAQANKDPLDKIKEGVTIESPIRWNDANVSRAISLSQREKKNEILDDEEKEFLAEWKRITNVQE